MKQYAIMSTNKPQLKANLRAAKRTYGKPTWENLPYVAMCWPLWIVSNKNSAIIECRHLNRDYESTSFYIELESYKD